MAGVTVQSQTFSSGTTFTVTCPAATPRATGGGASFSSSQNYLEASYPALDTSNKPKGWTVIAGSSSGTKTVYAICVADAS